MAAETSRNAVVTLAIGEKFRRLGELTHPWMTAYAERVGADFVVLDRADPALPHVAFTKGRLAELMDRYERIVFLDTDVLVSPTCPDLFAIVPEDRLGAVFVGWYTRGHDQAVRHVQDAVGDIGWDGRDYFNTGVMVLSRRHRAVVRSAGEDFERYAAGLDDGSTELFGEQTLYNYRVQRDAVPTLDLGPAFNHTGAIRPSRKRFRSHILHYAGVGHRRGSRLRQIRLDAAVLRRPWLHRTLATVPVLNLVLDRL